MNLPPRSTFRKSSILKQAELHLANNHPTLCIFDNFKGQLTDEVLQLLEDNFIDVVFVPLNCTDQLQPLDLSVNKSAKDIFKEKVLEMVFR